MIAASESAHCNFQVSSSIELELGPSAEHLVTGKHWHDAMCAWHNRASNTSWQATKLGADKVWLVLAVDHCCKTFCQ